MTASRGIMGPRVKPGTRSAWVAEYQGRHFCECGCGEPVQLRPEQYPNAPRFLHGHNTAITHAKPKPDRLPCECGCGELAGPGKRFISGHNGRGHKHSDATRAKQSATKLGPLNPHFGKRSTRWKGGRSYSSGYVSMWRPEHPYASNGRVMEHRLIMEAHLRRRSPGSSHLILLDDGQLYLRREIEVHHLNGVKDDNRVGNLIALSGSDHTRLHSWLKSR